MSISNLCQKDVPSQGQDGARGVCLHTGTEREWRENFNEVRILRLVASMC